ncbi:MAG: DUF3761 domain-containing protein [Rhodanobacter sp.]
MKISILAAVALAGLFLGSAAYAQQAAAPAGSSGQCKDGSYTSTASKRGACKGHKGVKEWYAASASKSAAASKVESKTEAKSEAAAPAAAAAAPAAAPKKSMGWTKPAAMAAAGGGPGMVWVNGKVYHCSTDKWYGKTKHGEYMSEEAAKAKGAHAEHGKVCTK